ncbi:MAG: replication-associated recombination protein A [Clostridia bacterium]|nr:replication-associated recombination protein A [Clostridia bacterium]
MPLADLIRPKELSEVVGQKHLFSPDSLFMKMTQSGTVPNMVFYGPSGTGKTTVANIIAAKSGMTLRKINATNASLSDIKDVLGETGTVFGSSGILLYIDEIQYFNKKQQQTVLEFIEDGRITLICSTTDNPYFSIYPAVLSRCSVFEFKSCDSEDIKKALVRAVTILDESKQKTDFDEKSRNEALDYISKAAGGDVRRAIGALEICYSAGSGNINLSLAEQSISGFALKMDKDGNEHYDLLSAFQKSIRGSDENAALFYLARMLEAGDLLSPIRRLLVIASEDIGLAHPMAVCVVKACCDNALQLGLPEARLCLAQAVVYLATLPKSNSSHDAYFAALEDVKSGKGQHMPDYIRDSMQPSANKNKDYVYPHPYPNHYYYQQYLPDDIKDRVYYHFADNKNEQAAKEYWKKVKGEAFKE